MKPREPAPIRVLVVDDSSVVAEYITHVLDSDPAIRVVGVARNGEQALEASRRLKPDVITMDIHMPRIDGFEATRQIMEVCPTPVVIVTGSSSSNDAARNFRALEAGAVALVATPTGTLAEKELLDTVKLMSEVKVVRRWARSRGACGSQPTPVVQVSREPSAICAVVIGASTGGPLVLQTILAGLPRNFPAPVLIVQHLSPGFAEGFVVWLSQSSGFPVRVAREDERLAARQAYLAPDGFHMGVSADHRVLLSRSDPEHGMRPSVSFLFRSAAAAFGRNVAGVLLTGMGRDGAQELKELRDAGAITIAQDEQSSVVFGMPGQAVGLDAAGYVLSPEEIVSALTAIVSDR